MGNGPGETHRPKDGTGRTCLGQSHHSNSKHEQTHHTPQTSSSVLILSSPQIRHSPTHLPHRSQLRSWHPMSNSIVSNPPPQQSSICPACVFYPIYVSSSQILIYSSDSNGRQTVGDGAYPVDTTPTPLVICRRDGHEDLYYYSTTFSGGPEVELESFYHPDSKHLTLVYPVAVLTSLLRNALQTEGRRTG